MRFQRLALVILVASVPLVPIVWFRTAEEPVAEALGVACPNPGPLAADIAALRDPATRSAALARLHALAKPRPLAVALGDALACADLKLRYAILLVIEQAGSELDGAVPVVARLIDDADSVTRALALSAIRRSGLETPAGDVTRALLGRMTHAGRDEQLQLLEVFKAITPHPVAWPRIAQELRNRDVAFRRAAAEAAWMLAKYATLPATAVEDLIAAAGDADTLVRGRAIGALGSARDRRAVAFLGTKLSAGDDETREWVVTALAASGELARDHQLSIAAIVRTDTAPMPLRTAAAGALGPIDADAPAAFEALLVGLLLPNEHLIERMKSDGREALRQAAESSLSALVLTKPAAVRATAGRLADNNAFQLLCDPRHARAIAPALVARIRREGRWGRSIEYCLGDQAQLAIGALPALLAQTRSSDLHTRVDAATGLRALRSSAAVPALVAQLGRAHARIGRDERGDDIREVLEVLHVLASLGRAPRASLAVWLERPDFRSAAAVALIATRADVTTGVRVLVAELASTSAAARGSAARELAAIIADDAAAELREPLAVAINDDDWHVREAAVISIAKLGKRAAPFLPKIRKLLQPYHSYMLWKATADALVAMGPAAAPVLPDLLATLLAGQDESLLPALVSILSTTPDAAARARAAFADEGYRARHLVERAIELARNGRGSSPSSTP